MEAGVNERLPITFRRLLLVWGVIEGSSRGHRGAAEEPSRGCVRVPLANQLNQLLLRMHVELLVHMQNVRVYGAFANAKLFSYYALRATLGKQEKYLTFASSELMLDGDLFAANSQRLSSNVICCVSGV